MLYIRLQAFGSSQKYTAYVDTSKANEHNNNKPSEEKTEKETATDATKKRKSIE